MRKSTITSLVAAALACLTVSCQKIEPSGQWEPKLKMTTGQLTDAVPVAYGQLMSVTPGPEPHSAVMWFRKPDESIVVVRINFALGALGPNVLEVPRK